MTPNVLALEPDQARERCLNLIRHGEQFSVEIDPRLRGMKDVVCVYQSAVLEHRPGWTHLRTRATHKDEACQYLYNLFASEISFQVNPEPQRDGRMEWLFLVELRARREAY